MGFPEFMFNEKNMIPASQQNTPDIEGYYYTANDGSQMALDAEELAQKGFYYFDACSDIEYEYGYSKVSYPDRALHFTDLPSNIQKIISDHIIDVDVSVAERIIVKHAY
jgi:hypothetical protein